MRDDHADGTVPAAGARISTEVSNAMVALHKEQFGRGPMTARTGYSNPDTLVTVLEGVLLPAERTMTEMGDGHRVQESRLHFQNATRARHIAEVERITGRRVRAFTSATDPAADLVVEISVFEPRDGDHNNGSAGHVDG